MHDDPRLTAYALGELDEDERALVEGWLDRDPELAVELAAIDDMADLLGEAFAREHELRPAPLAPKSASGGSSTGGSSTGAWWTLAAAAAVLLAIGVGVGVPDPQPRGAAFKTAPARNEATRDDRAPSDDVGVVIAEREVPNAPVQCTSPSDDSDLALELPSIAEEPMGLAQHPRAEQRRVQTVIE